MSPGCASDTSAADEAVAPPSPPHPRVRALPGAGVDEPGLHQLRRGDRRAAGQPHAGRRVGGAALGAAMGTATGAAIDGWSGAGIGGLAGAAAFGIVGTIADASVKDVTFMAITDVEIAERVGKGVIVREDRQQDAKQGVGGARRQSSTKVSEMNKYRTRVVSTANKANLQYEEAAVELTNGLARSISGLF